MGVIYQATEDERKLATEWHGGQASMLYAVASTGALATGTNRPWWNGEPMTDEEWREDLRSRLRMEVAEIRDADTAPERDKEIANRFIGHLASVVYPDEESET